MVQNGTSPGSIPSKRFDVWRRLYARFLLEPGPASGSRAEVLTAIQPITDVDAIIAKAVVQRATFDLTGASGTFKGFTVPAGERWRPGLIHGEATTGNTHIRARLHEEDGTPDTTLTITANDTNEKNIDVRGLILDEGDSIGWVNTQNAGDGARVIEVEMQIEERN